MPTGPVAAITTATVGGPRLIPCALAVAHGQRAASDSNVSGVIELSVLDLATVVTGSDAHQALSDTTMMARRADELGLTRIWVAEHHAMPGVASSAPAVLIAHLAAATTRIRVGSGGVMLPNHAPLVIAEQFGTLDALHPGRIDLGIGRAPGTDAATAHALRRGQTEDFPRDLLEVMAYFDGSHGRLAMPGLGQRPQIHLLGSSTYSAALAGELGLPFAYAYHFSTGYLEPALVEYRSRFRPSPVLDVPRVTLGVAVVCAPTAAEAAELAEPGRLSMLQLRQGRPSTLPTPEQARAYQYSQAERALVDQATASWIVGDPTQVAQGILALAERTGADEVMLSTRVFNLADRLRSVELTAHGLRAAGALAPCAAMAPAAP